MDLEVNKLTKQNIHPRKHLQGTYLTQKIQPNNSQSMSLLQGLQKLKNQPPF